MDRKEISIQLYTARKFQPYDNILKFFSESGIKNIELFGVDEIDEIEIFIAVVVKVRPTYTRADILWDK